MNASAPIIRIRTAIAALRQSGEPDCVWVAASLQDWLDGELPIERALELSPRWRCEMRRAERDAILRRIATHHFPGISGRPLAKALEGAIRAYETRAWPRDRRGNRPAGEAGDYFDLMRAAGDSGAPGFEQIRNILNDVAG